MIDSCDKMLCVQAHITSILPSIYIVSNQIILTANMTHSMPHNNIFRFKLFVQWCFKFFSLIFFSAHYMYLVMLFRNLKSYSSSEDIEVKMIRVLVISVLSTGFIFCHIPMIWKSWQWLGSAFSRFICQRAEHSIQFISIDKYDQKSFS